MPSCTICYINQVKQKHLIIILIDVEKPHEINKHQFLIKMLSKAKIEGNFLNLIKVSRKHIIVNDERPKACSLRSGKRQEYLQAHHIFSQVTTVVANAKRQERKNKYPERKERIQIPFFAEYMIVYV